MSKYDYIVRPGSRKGLPRSQLAQIPKEIIADLERRIVEVDFAKKVKAGQIGRFNLSSKLPKGISKKKALDIINNTDKYIKQTGVNRHGTVKGFREWLQRGKDEAQGRIDQLNDYLFPNTPRGDRPIGRMIQEGHVRSLAEEGPNVGSPPQQGRQNRHVGRWSGPDDTSTFIEMGHPENWDDALVQYLQGEDFVLTDLPQDLKTKISHLGYDPNQVIFEHDKFLLNKVGSPSVDVVPYKPWKGTEDMLSVGGKPITPPTPKPKVTELGRPLRGIGDRLKIARRLNDLPVVGELGAAGIIAGPSLLSGKPVQAMQELWQNLPEVTPVLGDVLDAVTSETGMGTWNYEQNAPTDLLIHQQNVEKRKARTNLVTSTAEANIPKYDFSGIRKTYNDLSNWIQTLGKIE